MKSTEFKLSTGLVIAALLTIFISPVSAQTTEDYHPFLSDKFNVDLGVFITRNDFDVRVDGSTPGEEIDFDQAIGISKNQSTGSANFRWRFGEKWSFWAQYWATNATNRAVLEEDIEWEDTVFNAGSFIKGGLGLDVARVFFGREFSTSLKHEFGLGLGFHWMGFDAFLEGEAFVDGESAGFRRNSVSSSIPLPNIGAWYMYSWSPKWIFQSRVDWLSASIGDYSGSLWDVQVGVNYEMFRNIGIGIYYKGYLIDVDVDNNDWRGSLGIKQAGPVLTFTATW